MMHHARLRNGFGGVMLFAIAGFAGCESADHGSFPSAQVVPVHWAPETPAAPIETKQVKYLGSASCNTTGCHGSADLNAPAWRNAQAKQLFNDPHTQAFRVLYGERSARMYERLELWPAGKSAPDQNPEQYSKDYREFLQKRCLGCHATPFETPANASLIDWQHALGGGVTCESCHGPAGEWGGTHFLPNFVNSRGAGTGFVDTKSLPARAQQCVGCHVGPMPYKIPDQADPVYHDMNHDLIAAGHPRLAFEFNAYWNALPAHWDVLGDKRRAESASVNNSSSLNQKRWAVGQWAAANQNLKLLSQRRKHTQPEFASYDCFDCHHELNEPSRRQWAMKDRRTPDSDPFRPGERAGTPRLNAWPFIHAQMLLPKRTADFTALFTDLAPEIQFRPSDQTLSTPLFPQDEKKIAGHLSPELLSIVDLQALLNSSSSSPNGSWDRLIQAYLAIHAFALDRNDPVLTESLQEFAEFLADQSFSTSAKVQPAVIYDSPTLFRVLRPTAGTPPEPAWDEAKFQALLDKLQHALTPARSPAAAP